MDIVGITEVPAGSPMSLGSVRMCMRGHVSIHDAQVVGGVGAASPASLRDWFTASRIRARVPKMQPMQDAMRWVNRAPVQSAGSGRRTSTIDFSARAVAARNAIPVRGVATLRPAMMTREGVMDLTFNFEIAFSPFDAMWDVTFTPTVMTHKSRAMATLLPFLTIKVPSGDATSESTEVARTARAAADRLELKSPVHSLTASAWHIVADAVRKDRGDNKDDDDADVDDAVSASMRCRARSREQRRAALERCCRDVDVSDALSSIVEASIHNNDRETRGRATVNLDADTLSQVRFVAQTMHDQVTKEGTDVPSVCGREFLSSSAASTMYGLMMRSLKVVSRAANHVVSGDLMRSSKGALTLSSIPHLPMLCDGLLAVMWHLCRLSDDTFGAEAMDAVAFPADVVTRVDPVGSLPLDVAPPPPLSPPKTQSEATEVNTRTLLAVITRAADETANASSVRLVVGDTDVVVGANSITDVSAVVKSRGDVVRARIEGDHEHIVVLQRATWAKTQVRRARSASFNSSGSGCGSGVSAFTAESLLT